MTLDNDSSRPSQPRQRAALQVCNPNAAGIDVHDGMHWVAIPPDRDPESTRKFGTFTADLEALADWLRHSGIDTVAMESTGIYWVPLYELLERRGFRVYLVDPRCVQRASGRPKTDIHDCQWIQRLHSYGLLDKAFRPEDQVVVLRGMVRQRAMLITYAAQHIQHIQKALQQMNLKLTLVVSDVVGVTGMRILKAIVAGERDPHRLASLRDRRCGRSEEEIAKALVGTWRTEHLLALKQAVELFDFYHTKIRECDVAVEAFLRQLPSRSAGKQYQHRPKHRQGYANELTFDARRLLWEVLGVDLTAIEGIEVGVALVIASELGADLSAFATEKAFCSWLGLSPNHRISAGKVKGRKVRPGANRVARALRLAAWSLVRSKSAMGAFYRRMRSRLGAPKAVTATAHKLARLVYRLLKHGEAYVAQGEAEYEAKFKERKLKAMTRQAQELGYVLVPQLPVVATSVT